MAEPDDDRPRLPMIVYLVIGVLAVIGLFSISSFVFSAIFWLVRLVIGGAIALLILGILKAVLFGRNDRHARSDT